MSQVASSRPASPVPTLTLKSRSKFDNLYGQYKQTGLLTPPLTPPRTTFELPAESEHQSTASLVAPPRWDYPALAKKGLKILGAEAKDMACDIVRGQIKKMVKGLFWRYFHILFAMTVGVTILGSLVLCVAQINRRIMGLQRPSSGYLRHLILFVLFSFAVVEAALYYSECFPIVAALAAFWAVAFILISCIIEF